MIYLYGILYYTECWSGDFGMEQVMRKAMISTMKPNKKVGIILEFCPSLSASTVERHLRKLTAEGYISKYGAGKNTFYVKN